MTVLERLAASHGLAVLVDPARTSEADAAVLARRAAGEGAALLLLGNSFGSAGDTPAVARVLRTHAPDLPLLQFPATAAQLVCAVDAILFLSLVSGRNPQYLIEEHVRAVPFVNRHPDVEIISTAYCLVDGGRVSTVESVTQTRPLPADKPEVLAMHVQAGMLLGMHATYLEAGSGAARPISPVLVRTARAHARGPLFVGGGIRTPDDVRRARDAGADFVVVGTLFEEEGGARAITALAGAARS